MQLRGARARHYLTTTLGDDVTAEGHAGPPCGINGDGTFTTGPNRADRGVIRSGRSGWVTSSLRGDHHCLLGKAPALLRPGGHPEDVGRLWGQTRHRELAGVGAHLHRGELVGVAGVQAVGDLVPCDRDSRRTREEPIRVSEAFTGSFGDLRWQINLEDKIQVRAEIMSFQSDNIDSRKRLIQKKAEREKTGM